MNCNLRWAEEAERRQREHPWSRSFPLSRQGGVDFIEVAPLRLLRHAREVLADAVVHRRVVLRYGPVSGLWACVCVCVCANQL